MEVNLFLKCCNYFKNIYWNLLASTAWIICWLTISWNIPVARLTIKKKNTTVDTGAYVQLCKFIVRPLFLSLMCQSTEKVQHAISINIWYRAFYLCNSGVGGTLLLLSLGVNLISSLISFCYLQTGM